MRRRFWLIDYDYGLLLVCVSSFFFNYDRPQSYQPLEQWDNNVVKFFQNRNLCMSNENTINESWLVILHEEFVCS